jgi:hypothetical protein
MYYVLRHGRMFSLPVDFNMQREHTLKKIPSKIFHKSSVFSRLRHRLSQSRLTGTLIGSLAYLKNAREINKNFFIIPSKQLCYVRIFKSASTSVLRSIIPQIDFTLKGITITDKQIDALATTYVKRELIDVQQQYVLFTVIRNPFERLVSVYLDIFNPDNNQFGYSGFLFGVLKQNMRFSDFVSVLTEIPTEWRGPHFASQFQLINDCGGLEKIKHFRLDKDITVLKDFMMSFDLDFHHNNKNPNPYDYKSFYNINTLRLAYNLYKDDVETFDYRLEYLALKEYVNARKT